MRGILLAGAALAAPASAAGQQFNLACDVTSWGFDQRQIFKRENERDFKLEYRVDLGAGRWCVGQCETSEPVEGASDRLIILERTKINEDSDIYTTINREDGSYLSRAKFGYGGIITVGKCTLTAFTGLPTRKF